MKREGLEAVSTDSSVVALLYRVPEKVTIVGGAEGLGIGVCKAWLPQTVGSAELWPGGGTQEFVFHASSRVLPVLRSGAPL